MNPVFIILAVVGFAVVGIVLIPVFGKLVYKITNKLEKSWNGDEEEKEEKEK